MKQKTLHRMVRKYMIAAASIPILILGAFACTNITDDYLGKIEISAKQALLTTQRIITDFDENNRHGVRIFSEHPDITKEELKEIAPDKVMSAIQVLETNTNGALSMALGLEDGRMFTRFSNNLPPGYDPRTRPWYRAAVENSGQVVLTEPYESATRPGSFDITYALTLKDEDSGELKGVIGLDVSLSSLETIISNLQVGPGGTVCVVDKGGRLLFGQYDLLRYELSRNQDVVRRLITVTDLKRPIQLFGKTYILRRTQDTNTGWYTVVLISEEALYEDRIEIIVTVGIAILLMLVAAWILSKRAEGYLTESIDTLTKQIGDFQLAETPEPIQLKAAAPSEIKIIQEAINAMVTRIQGQGTALLEQKKEIAGQYMEINALYEETVAMNDALNELVTQLKTSNRKTIEALSNAIEANDHYTKGHCERVTRYAVALGRRWGMGEGDLEVLELSSLLHDVGKVGVPSHILNKEASLTAEEFNQIKRHPVIGAGIIEGVPFLEVARRIILQHHERYDGNGYPSGLSEETIDLSARIIGIADAYDAMTSARPYRKAPLSKEAALQELMNGRGTQFDPELMILFSKLLSEEDYESDPEPTDSELQ